MVLIIMATCVMESCTWNKGNNGKHTVLNFPYESFPRPCGGSFQARCRHCSNRTSTRPRRCFGRPSAGLKSSRLSKEWDLQLAIRRQWQLLWGVWSSTQRPKGICLIYFHTQSHYYSTISTKGVCLSYPQALRLVSWLDTIIWLNTSKK